VKRCARCKEIKKDKEFSWNNRQLGIRQKHCKSCMSFFSRRHYVENREEELKRLGRNRDRSRNKARKFVWNYLKDHPCVLCAEKDPRVLEFDHLDPSEKTNNISRMVRDGFGIERIRSEIAKCQVLCANCHRKRHYEDGSWFTG
jgi:hypothetical protein